MNQKRIVNKIEAIKTLRDFCQTTWGQPGSLNTAKELVESIMAFQTVTLTTYQVNRILLVAAEDFSTNKARAEAISHIINEETF